MMKKKLILFIAFFLISIFKPSQVVGYFDNRKDLNNSQINKIFQVRKVLKQVFENYQSPLVDEVDTFIDVCIKYDFNCYLLPAIAGLESSYGRYIYPDSYNPFGWGGGYIKFKSWQNAIEIVSFNLKNNYFNKGLKDIYSIGKVYAESSTWSERINYLINNFNQMEDSNYLYFYSSIVKL